MPERRPLKEVFEGKPLGRSKQARPGVRWIKRNNDTIPNRRLEDEQWVDR
jgi:hypothetical protein